MRDKHRKRSAGHGHCRKTSPAKRNRVHGPEPAECNGLDADPLSAHCNEGDTQFNPPPQHVQYHHKIHKRVLDDENGKYQRWDSQEELTDRFSDAVAGQLGLVLAELDDLRDVKSRQNQTAENINELDQIALIFPLVAL